MVNNYEEGISDEVFGKLSKINSAGMVNSTLTNLWIDFFRHYRDGRYLAANSDLDCLWTILGGEKNIEGSVEEREYKEIEKKFVGTGKLQDAIASKGFERVTDTQLISFAKHKKILLEKSLFLRRLQNKQGKGTAYNDGDDEDFE